MRPLTAEIVAKTIINNGSGVAGGKGRIWRYYRTEHPSNKDFAKFLAKEYGWGGCSHAYTIKEMVDPDYGLFVGEDHDNKGIRLRLFKQQYDPEKKLWPTETWHEVQLPWTHVAALVASAIDEGRYIRMQDVAGWAPMRKLRKTIAA